MGQTSSTSDDEGRRGSLGILLCRSGLPFADMDIASHLTPNQTVQGCSPIRLPLELVDHVIDHLQHDRCSLLACALTGRAWLPRSRYYLFRVVDVSADSRRLDALALLAQSPSAFLLKLVQHLDIDAQQYTSSIQEVLQMFTGTILHAVRLTIRNVAYAGANEPRELFMRLPVFTSVTTLIVHSSMIKSFSLLCRLVSAFPHLSVLSLHRVYVATLDQPTNPTDQSPIVCSIRLTMLSVFAMQAQEMNHLLTWITESPITHPIRDLVLWRDCYKGNLQKSLVINLLQTTGSTLESLALDVTALKSEDITDVASAFGSSSCNLRSLIMPLDLSPSTNVRIWLSNVSSRSLKELKFVIRSTWYCQADLEAAKSFCLLIDCVTELDAFASLSTVSFQLPPRSGLSTHSRCCTDDPYAVLQALFPSLYRRGLLRLADDGDLFRAN